MRRSATSPSIHGLQRLTGSSHIFEYLTGSGHYHFGDFEDAAPQGHDARSLTSAMHRLALRDRDLLDRQLRILDIGCGNGGTTRLLSEAGYRTLGIDTACGSIAYARRAAMLAHLDADYIAVSFEEFARKRPVLPRFGSLVLIEVTQHFASLPTLLRGCHDLLVEGGHALIRDVFTTVRLPRQHVPYHARKDVASAVAMAGFELRRCEDITRSVVPTILVLRTLLELHRDALRRSFGSLGFPIDAEIQELDQNLSILGRALQNGDIVYETSVAVRA